MPRRRGARIKAAEAAKKAAEESISAPAPQVKPAPKKAAPKRKAASKKKAEE